MKNNLKTANTKKFISVSIESDGDSDNTFAKLSNGANLGLVQSIDWSCKVGELARCQITTLLTKAQLSALMEDSIIRYRLIDKEKQDRLIQERSSCNMYPNDTLALLK